MKSFLMIPFHINTLTISLAVSRVFYHTNGGGGSVGDGDDIALRTLNWASGLHLDVLRQTQVRSGLRV